MDAQDKLSGFAAICIFRLSIPHGLQPQLSPSTHPALLQLNAPPSLARSAPQRYWDPQSGKPWRFLSAAMIEAEYKRSPQWAALQSVLDAPFDRATADPRALATKK